MAQTPQNVENYGGNFSEGGFWNKLFDAGGSLVYKALQLYYAAQSPACPMSVKATIYGALGYFILPVDLVPDMIPVVGYADDLGAIGTAITIASNFIDEDVIQKAQSKMIDLFGTKARKFF